MTQCHLNIKTKIMLFSENTRHIKAKFFFEASMLIGGNKILCANTGSNAQYGRHAHKCSKSFTKLGMQYLGLLTLVSYSNDGPMMTLTNFTTRSVLQTWKSENDGYFGNYCSLRPQRGQQ